MYAAKESAPERSVDSTFVGIKRELDTAGDLRCARHNGRYTIGRTQEPSFPFFLGAYRKK